MTASKEIAIVLGETFPDLARQYYGDGSKFGVKITIHLSRQGAWNSACCKSL
jgi:dTDP-glucose pyrophosphorylase